MLNIDMKDVLKIELLEMKTTMSQMTNTFVIINSRLDIAEKQIRTPEDIVTEILCDKSLIQNTKKLQLEKKRKGKDRQYIQGNNDSQFSKYDENFKPIDPISSIRRLHQGK